MHLSRRITAAVVALGLSATIAMVGATSASAVTRTLLYEGPFYSLSQCQVAYKQSARDGVILTQGCRRSAGGVGLWWFQYAV